MMLHRFRFFDARLKVERFIYFDVWKTADRKIFIRFCGSTQGPRFWGMCLKSAPDELIGVTWLKRKGRPSNRGFWLGRKFWRQGIMTEALKPVTDYAFDVLGFEKLVLAKCGGQFRVAANQGEYRSGLCKDGARDLCEP